MNWIRIYTSNPRRHRFNSPSGLTHTLRKGLLLSMPCKQILKLINII